MLRRVVQEKGNAMPSLDFEAEKKTFREFHDNSNQLLHRAKESFAALINALVTNDGRVSKVDGRVKEKEECIRKFNLKYRTALETKQEAYAIQDHISDLIGLRIVCLYEDDVDVVKDVLFNHFDVLEVTDKTLALENTEGSFGYKGLHLDLKLGDARRVLPEYTAYSDLSFEVQVRTVIQDSWSVLDHKIKYKKSIPNFLKRRINTLAALFELADREFRAIRDSTEDEIRKAEEVVVIDEVLAEPEPGASSERLQSVTPQLDAFAFLRIAKHFFKFQEFEPHKVDGFTSEILGMDPKMTRAKLNTLLKNNLATVKGYKDHFESTSASDKLNPFTMIRHALYLGDQVQFANLLTNVSRDAFNKWLAVQAVR